MIGFVTGILIVGGDLLGSVGASLERSVTSLPAMPYTPETSPPADATPTGPTDPPTDEAPDPPTEPPADDPDEPPAQPTDPCAGSRWVQRSQPFTGNGSHHFVVPQCVSEVLVRVWAGDPNDWICAEGRPYVRQRLPVTPGETLSIKFNKGNGGHHAHDKGKGGNGGGRKIGHYQAVISRGSHNLIAIGEPDDATPSQCVAGGNGNGLAIFTWNEPA